MERPADMTPSRAGPDRRLALAAFAVLGGGYWLTLFTPGFAGDWALKAAPMLLAAAVLAICLPKRFGLPMATGFAFSAAGDVFLALDRAEYLMQALSCFLVTQIAYAIAFSGRARGLLDRLRYRVPVAVYGVVLLVLMLPGLGGFLVPVAVYVSALVAMGWMAAGFERSTPGRIFHGACLFVVADSLIGVDRFIGAIPFGEIVIVGCYTTAQFLIFSGMLHAFHRGPVGSTP
jgi:uncharacterized membrane protein YhhN